METVTPTYADIQYEESIAAAVRKGWRVESQTASATRLVKGHRTNHILHLILTIITAGLWLPVWIGMVVLAGEKHRTITRGA